MNFPTSPALNDTYSLGSKTWKWNGVAWDLVSTGLTSTHVVTALGFTPLNKAGDTLTGALSVSGNVTLNGGTANGVTYLNGSNVLTSGSALTFDGTSLGMGNPTVYGTRSLNSYTGTTASAVGFSQQVSGFGNTWVGINNSGSTVLGMATGTFGQSTTNNIPWTVSAYGSEQMRLTSTGLGIGTSSPSYKLDVLSQNARLYSGAAGSFAIFRVGGAGSDSLWGYAGATNDIATGSSAGDTVFGTNKASANLRFLSGNGSLNATLDSAGNLGLGVTPSAWGGAYKAIQFGIDGVLNATTSTTNGVILAKNFFNNGAGNKYINTDFASFYQQISGQHQWFTAASGTAGNAISFTQAMTLDASSNLTVAANVTAYSDERLKKDWLDLPADFVERLAEVKHGTYTRIDNGQRQAGVGAQSLKPLLPEVILEGEHLSVAYGNAAMVSAVELAKRVVRLEKALANLMGD